jgi:hypothetical protein
VHDGQALNVLVKPSQNNLSFLTDLRANNLGASLLGQSLSSLVDVPPTVERLDGETASLVAPFVADAKIAADFNLQEGGTFLDDRTSNLAVFDAILNNRDRTLSNFLVVGDGAAGEQSIVAIDHDWAFSPAGSALLGPVSWHAGEALTPAQITAVKDLQRQLPALTAQMAARGLSPVQLDELRNRTAFMVKKQRLPTPTDQASSYTGGARFGIDWIDQAHRLVSNGFELVRN